MKTNQRLPEMKTATFRSASAGEAGAALVEVMIGVLLGAILMVGLASFFVYQTDTMASVKAIQSRDIVAAMLARNAANMAVLNASANFAGSGGWPSNTGAGDFRDCWLGGNGNLCSHGTEKGLTLVDAGGNVLAGPGQNANPRWDGTTAVYSKDSRLCGINSNVAPYLPEPLNCPFVVYTTFTPICENGACATGIAARAIKISYYIRQGNTAQPIILRGGGRLKPYSSSIITTKSTYGRGFPLSACPSGMVMAGSGRGVYCIESTARAAKTWENSSKTCLGAGYTLCTYSEFAQPCLSAAITHTGGAEWSAESAGNAGRAVTLNVGNVCSDNQDALVGNSLPFRCCTR